MDDNPTLITIIEIKYFIRTEVKVTPTGKYICNVVIRTVIRTVCKPDPQLIFADTSLG
jgi:hypothetical protein